MNNEIKVFYGYCECKVDLNSEIIRYLEMRVCMWGGGWGWGGGPG